VVSDARLLAVVYDDRATAEQALGVLLELADAGALELKDAAVVVHVRDRSGGAGSVELHQTRALAAGEGIVGGGTIGLLVGLAVGIPVAGAIVGIAGGAGALAFDTGISDDQMRRVGGELQAGRAALFALVGAADWERVREGLAPYDGELAASELSAEVMEALAATGPEP
jgi:uncharacterized membrane protein